MKQFLEAVNPENFEEQVSTFIQNTNQVLQFCHKHDLPCIKERFNSFLYKLSKTEYLSKVDRHFLKAFFKDLEYRENRYFYKGKEDFRAWIQYIHNKRQFGLDKYAGMDEKLRKRLNRIYDRKLYKIGSVNIIDYLLMMFNRGEIGVLSNTFQEASALSTSVDGKIVINLSNNNVIEFLQRQLDNSISSIDFTANQDLIDDIDDKFLRIAGRLKEARENQKQILVNENQRKSLEEKKGQLITEALNAQTQPERIAIYQSINEVNLRLMSLSGVSKDVFALDLSQRDVYHFSHRYLTYQVSLMNARQDFQNRAVSVGDLLISDLIIGNTKPEVLNELLKVSLLNEGYEPFWKRALKFIPSLVVSTQLLFPGVGQIVGVSYAIVSSLQSVKSMNQEKVDDAHIF